MKKRSFFMKKNIYLTLIVVSFTFGQNSQSPYSLRWNTDSWIIGSAVVGGIGAYAIETHLPALTESEISLLNKNNINPIDRISAGNYSTGQASVSDVLVGVSIASPLCMLADKKIRNDFFTLAAMYAETEMLSAILPSLGKGTAKRVRPFVYDTSVPINIRLESDSQRSFFSRHSTFAFSTAVLTSIVYSDYFPDSKYRPYVWVGSLSLATSVAALRVTSGSHFISDVVVGAAVGSAIGYFIPYIHRNSSSANPMSIAPLIAPPTHGFTISIRF
jgi:membrane-associated phospholipid phosphatase